MLFFFPALLAHSSSSSVLMRKGLLSPYVQAYLHYHREIGAGVYPIRGFVEMAAVALVVSASVSIIFLILKLLRLPHLARLKEINDALKKQVREHKQTEENLRELLEAVPDALIVTNYDGKIVLANVQAEKLFGYCKEEFLGMPVETLMPTSAREGHQEHQRQFFSNPRNRPMGVGLQLFGRRKSGEVFPADISLSPLKRGEDLLVSSTIRDVTDHRRIQDEIRHLNDELIARNTELVSANKELESFSYSVAHDLRSPLRTIDGFSLAMLEDCASGLGEVGESYLKHIRDAATHMDHLINDLLSLAKTSRTEMRREKVDLSSLAEAILVHLKNAEPQRQIAFSIAPDLIAEGDRVLLRSALENLLGNAWKFTAKRQDAHIEVGSIRSGAEELYFVRDNGVGFDMQDAEKIFGTFQRLHNQSEFPGTGIGLAIVQRVVERHGGHIWAEAALGCGAVFYFSLSERLPKPKSGRASRGEPEELSTIGNS